MLNRFNLLRSCHLKLLFCFAWSFVAPLAAVAQRSPLPLTRAGEVHDLPAAEAARRIPVHLVATVTYYDAPEHTLFVEDASGAVYVRTTHPYVLRRGDLVRIDGFTAKSFRTVVAADPKIDVVGFRSTHHPHLSTDHPYTELMDGRWDCKYVTVRGVVRSAMLEDHGAATVLELALLVPGGTIQAYLQDYRGVDPKKLVDAEIEISGVVAGDFNAKWQLMRSVLYAADPTAISLRRQPRTAASHLRLTPIDGVMQTHFIKDETERVRVRGTVTFYRAGNSVVIQQGRRSLFAVTRQAGPVPIGALVDLIGFAGEGGYGPSLQDTEIVPLGSYAPVAPEPVSYLQALSGAYSDDLISVRGRLISEQHADSSDTLLLSIDQHPVTVVLQSPEKDRWLPKLPYGTWVTVSGLCRITPTAAWGTPGTTPMLFRIDMRSRDDLQVLSWPSWWNFERLLLVLKWVLLSSMAVVVWAFVLRRRVAVQTASIERTMRLERARSRLLEGISSEDPLEILIAKVCRFVATLAPGVSSRCTLAGFSINHRQGALSLSIGEVPPTVLHQVILTDSKGQEMGCFCAGREASHPLDDYETEVLTIASDVARLALNQRLMYEELNYTSCHDQLTGLPNRRSADATLELALQRAAAAGTHVAVAYIDLDRFKEVNDQYGHRIGDLYLQQVAVRLAAQIRPGDMLARIGGDEFLMIASDIRDSDEADVYRSALRSCFEESFPIEDCLLAGFASIGIAVSGEDHITAEALKRRADAEMYRAKSEQRHCQEEVCQPFELEIFSAVDVERALARRQVRVC